MLQEHGEAQVVITVAEQLIDVVGRIFQHGMLQNRLDQRLVQRHLRQYHGNAAIEFLQFQSFLNRRLAEIYEILVRAKIFRFHQLRRADFLVHHAANRRITIPFDLRNVVGRRRGECNDERRLQSRLDLVKRFPPLVSQVMRFIKHQCAYAGSFERLHQRANPGVLLEMSQRLIRRDRQQARLGRIGGKPIGRIRFVPEGIQESANPLVADGDSRRKDQRRFVHAAQCFQPDYRLPGTGSGD